MLCCECQQPAGSTHLKTKIKTIQNKNQAAKYGQQRREQWLQAFGNAKERAIRIPNWFKDDDPVQVNRTLHFLLAPIITIQMSKLKFILKNNPKKVTKTTKS